MADKVPAPKRSPDRSVCVCIPIIVAPWTPGWVSDDMLRRWASTDWLLGRCGLQQERKGGNKNQVRQTRTAHHRTSDRQRDHYEREMRESRSCPASDHTRVLCALHSARPFGIINGCARVSLRAVNNTTAFEPVRGRQRCGTEEIPTHWSAPGSLPCRAGKSGGRRGMHGQKCQ
jgi:hypothetical protein